MDRAKDEVRVASSADQDPAHDARDHQCAPVRCGATGWRNKVVTAAEAARLVMDGDTVATGGFIGIGFAENLAAALEKRFVGEDPLSKAVTPKGLTLVYAAGQGDGKDRGLNYFGHEGMVRRVIGGHWGLAPKLQQLAIAGKIGALIGRNVRDHDT